VPIDVKNRGAVVRRVNHVGRPEFVVQGFGHGEFALKCAWKQAD